MTIAVLPESRPEFVEAVHLGGGVVAPLGSATTGVVWLDYGGGERLAEVLREHPQISWVQLPWAGVDAFAPVFASSARNGLTWTSAKGAYAAPVAEHAVALTLALLRSLQVRARATTWGGKAGRNLYGARVVVIGAGGIAREYVRMIAPFGVKSTVVRRSEGSVDWADRTVTTDALDDVLGDADVVMIAAASTGETARMFDERRLALLPSTAVLVNVARGALVDTDALAAALASGGLGGAGLDVTDPEPLPDGHALWTEPLCLVTPHSADTPEMTAPLLAARITANTAALLDGSPMTGVVDVGLGY